MGGEDSEVSAETTDLLLEAANFDPLTVLRTSRRLRLRTEGSTRWEKGVDPYAAEQAAVYATQLLVELAGARWTGQVDVNDGLPERPGVRFSPSCGRAMSGPRSPEDEQLERLGRSASRSTDRTVTVPTWRARDVTRPGRPRRGGRKLPHRGHPVDAAGAAGDVGRLTASSACGRRSRTSSSEPVLRGVHVTLVQPDDPGSPLQELPGGLAALRERVLRHWLVEVGAAEAERRHGESGSRCSSSRASSSRPARSCPDERWRVAGIVDGGYAQAKGRSRRSTARSTFEPDWPRRRSTSASSTTGWSYFELDLDALFARVPEGSALPRT